jgi:hypothetical protein
MRCKKCKQDKDENNFYLAKNGHESTCKDCRNKIKYQQRRNNRIIGGLNIHAISTLEARELLAQHKKYCPRCKIIKDIDEFSTMKVRGKISSHCRECSREMLGTYYGTDNGKEAKRKQYMRDKMRLKDLKLRKKYGITLNEYGTILQMQGCGCAICGKTEKENEKMLAVDHCHETKTNRALLCSKCNMVIGFIEKNKLDIDDIRNYVVEHKINQNAILLHPRRSK